ncbi:hypothetical protein KC19_6G072300 [Ceratodon purpureus]|uniref:Uncharacterized protein n=1 Tax=Ceratodon purpureus TaxID=3225 RepID=A0A8T0HIB1_CERPU|nr:hypothetical protein KC19_6G072300 [Ceratodon purpureus]
MLGCFWYVSIFMECCVHAEVIKTCVPDIEEPHCRRLLKRVALRNLEEMVAIKQIDEHAIPLMKELTTQDSGAESIGSTVKQRFYKELFLRVQTEAVLSVLREDVDEIDWASYKLVLESVFGEAEGDNCLLERKRELSALLKPKNQNPAVVADYLEKHKLQKLMGDLSSFIEEKKDSFKITFLDQLARDFLDAGGTPFPEEPGDVKKSTVVDGNGKQYHVGHVNFESLRAVAGTHANEDMNIEEVGQNPKLNETRSQHDMNGTGDRNIVSGSPTVSKKKRPRRKLLVSDVESEEAEEDNEGAKKLRKISPTSVIYNTIHHSVSGKSISRPGPQNGCSSLKQGVESVKHLSSSRKGEEALSTPQNIGSKVVRPGNPPLHASMNLGGVELEPKDSRRTGEYVIISDAESDAETQVVNRLSIDAEDDSIGDFKDNDHHKKGDQSLSENGFDRGHLERAVPTEAVRKGATIVQSERNVLVDSRKEASTASPGAQTSEQGDNKKCMTKRGSTAKDSQDIYEVDFLEVGSDGHENFCHSCGLGGNMICCDGCAISMHPSCIKVLGLRVPPQTENWYCPICVSQKAAREAAEAEKAAAAAKEKLIAFQESVKRRISVKGDLLHHPKQEKTAEQSSLRVNLLQPDELEKASMPQQRPEGEAQLRLTEGRQDSDSPKVSPKVTFLRSGSHQRKKLAEQGPKNTGEDTTLENRSLSKRVASFGQGEEGKISNDVGSAPRVNERMENPSSKALLKNGAVSIRDRSAKSVFDEEDVKPHKSRPSHDQEVSRRNPLAASTSGLLKNESEPVTGPLGPEFHSGEERTERGVGGTEPGSGAAGLEEVGDDRDDEVPDEDSVEKSEYMNQNPFLSGRRKIAGLRRTRLPWTRQEELALKEGVKRFSYNGVWGFQWKRILEFGQGRFDPSRTDVDLKDKWRNLVKGVS